MAVRSTGGIKTASPLLLASLAVVVFCAVVWVAFGVDDRWLTPMERTSAMEALHSMDEVVQSNGRAGAAVVAAAETEVARARRWQITGRDRKVGSELDALFDGAKSCYQFTARSVDGDTNPRLEEFRKVVCDDYRRDAADLGASLGKDFLNGKSS